MQDGVVFPALREDGGCVGAIGIYSVRAGRAMVGWSGAEL